MNYFAHGFRFLHRPYFLAGTALPDLMSVVDRKVRLRSKLVQPFVGEEESPEVELARGVLQHLHDDDWFHVTPAFLRVSDLLTRHFREGLPPDESPRNGFLGHIVTEILLDAWLIAHHPEVLTGYYHAWQTVDPARVQTHVNRMAKQPTDRLAVGMVEFHAERFLADYADDEKLWYRLNQVMRRVKLSPLPADGATLITAARGLVAEHAIGLLAGWDERDLDRLRGGAGV